VCCCDYLNSKTCSVLLRVLEQPRVNNSSTLGCSSTHNNTLQVLHLLSAVQVLTTTHCRFYCSSTHNNTLQELFTLGCSSTHNNTLQVLLFKYSQQHTTGFTVQVLTTTHYRFYCSSTHNNTLQELSTLGCSSTHNNTLQVLLFKYSQQHTAALSTLGCSSTHNNTLQVLLFRTAKSR
jgi:ribosomal protein L30/L7E